MKYIEFEYTDRKAKTSKKKVLVLATPNKHLTGLDVSEIGDTHVAEFASEYNRLHTEFLNKVEKLKHHFDLSHNFRQYDPEKMLISEEEYL